MRTMCRDKSRPIEKLGSVGPKQMIDLLRRIRKYQHTNRWRYWKAERRVLKWIQETV